MGFNKTLDYTGGILLKFMVKKTKGRLKSGKTVTLIKIGSTPKKLVTRTRLCFIKPLSLTLWASGRFAYHIFNIMSDRATQECDPSTMMAPNGMGLVSLLTPTLPDEAQG